MTRQASILGPKKGPQRHTHNYMPPGTRSYRRYLAAKARRAAKRARKENRA